MIKKKFARKSNANGLGMSSGFIFRNGEYYCETEEQAKAYVEKLGLNWEFELKKFGTRDEWFFYTEWDILDEEEFYDKEGNKYMICNNCKNETIVNEDFYFCMNCLKQL